MTPLLKGNRVKAPWTKTEKVTISELITATQTEMFGMTVGTEEYDHALEKLERLYKLKNLNKDFRISPDTLLIVGGNLAGLLLVLNFERVGVITSKALGFIIKSRI